jgi:hypothetical protein
MSVRVGHRLNTRFLQLLQDRRQREDHVLQAIWPGITWLARNPSKVDTKQGDPFLQTAGDDLLLFIQRCLSSNLWISSALNSLTRGSIRLAIDILVQQTELVINVSL